MTEHLHTVIVVITYNFISLKTIFFFVIINPSFPRYILHILHGHPSGAHLLILNLKPLRFRFLFHWVLNPIFLDLDRTPIQCYATFMQRIYFIVKTSAMKHPD